MNNKSAHTRVSLIEKDISFIKENIAEVHSLVRKMDESIDRLESFKNKIYGAFVVSNIITAFVINYFL